MQIVVLNDGTTWTNIAGCVVADVPDDYDGDSPLSAATRVRPIGDMADDEHRNADPRRGGTPDRQKGQS